MALAFFIGSAVQSNRSALSRIWLIGWCQGHLEDDPRSFSNHHPVGFALLRPRHIHWVTEKINVKDVFHADHDRSTAHGRKVLVKVRSVLAIYLERIIRIEQVDLEAGPHVLHCDTWM
jgi:hypothetical protein